MTSVAITEVKAQTPPSLIKREDSYRKVRKAV